MTSNGKPLEENSSPWLSRVLIMNIVSVLHTHFNVVGIISSIGICGVVIGYGVGSLVNNKYVTLEGKGIV